MTNLILNKYQVVHKYRPHIELSFSALFVHTNRNNLSQGLGSFHSGKTDSLAIGLRHLHTRSHGCIPSSGRKQSSKQGGGGGGFKRGAHGKPFPNSTKPTGTNSMGLASYVGYNCPGKGKMPTKEGNTDTYLTTELTNSKEQLRLTQILNNHLNFCT